MPRSYKLRLGDGTVLVVDHGGLSSWLGDRRALVQPAGSDLWKPLKEFLVQERSAARRAARHPPKPPSTPREALPLVYPKPRGKPASGSPKEPIPVRADGLPLIPPPPPKPRDDPEGTRRRPAPAPPTTVVRPSLPKPPAPPVLRKPTPPVAPPLPIPPRPPDDRVVVRPSLPKTPPAPVLARQPVEPRGGETKPTADSGLPRIAPPPPLIAPTPPTVPPKLPTLSPPPLLISPPPLISAPPPTVSPTPRDNRDEVPTPSVPSAPVEPPAGPTVVQPLAEEPPSDEDVEWMTLPEPLGEPLVDDEPPARPSLQEAPLPARLRAPSAFETALSQRIERLARRDWQATRLWLTSQAASAYGTLLMLWKGLARRDRPPTAPSPRQPAPRRAVESERSAPMEPRPSVGVPSGVRVRAEKRKDSLGVYSPRRSTDDGLPILQLEPLDDLEPLVDEQGSTDDGLEIDLEPLDDEVPTGVPSKPPKPDDRTSAPLPVPRSAAPPRPVPSASPRTKRLLVMGGLVAAGLFAALSSETWLPKAAPSGRLVVKTGRLKQSGDEAERQRQAQQAARQRLPHLAPETIRLVLAKSATGVLDPPALFRVTCDAVDRGSWALTPEEAQELQALRRELLDALLPSEAERVLEYDDTRARRATLPFENRAALDLFARGVRALPSRSRTRLQVLFGKAVAAAQLRAEGTPRL